MKRRFVKTGKRLVAVDRIVSADYSDIENLRLSVTDQNGWTHDISGLDALEAAMVLNPACLEGHRLRWPKHVWAFHNLVGHPLMQVLAWFKQYKLAFWLHDMTVPKPKEKR